MTSELPTPVTAIILAAVLTGALLLVVPFAPPQAAIFGFIAILLIGLSGYVALTVCLNILYQTADDVLPEEPDEYEEYPVDGEVVDAYLEGELTDAEFEAEIEAALDDEDAPDTSDRTVVDRSQR